MLSGFELYPRWVPLINNLPLAWQFALKAIKLQMFGGKTRLAPYYNMFFLSRYS